MCRWRRLDIVGRWFECRGLDSVGGVWVFSKFVVSFVSSNDDLFLQIVFALLLC